MGKPALEPSAGKLFDDADLVEEPEHERIVGRGRGHAARIFFAACQRGLGGMSGP